MESPVGYNAMKLLSSLFLTFEGMKKTKRQKDSYRFDTRDYCRLVVAVLVRLSALCPIQLDVVQVARPASCTKMYDAEFLDSKWGQCKSYVFFPKQIEGIN